PAAAEGRRADRRRRGRAARRAGGACGAVRARALGRRRDAGDLAPGNGPAPAGGDVVRIPGRCAGAQAHRRRPAAQRARVRGCRDARRLHRAVGLCRGPLAALLPRRRARGAGDRSALQRQRAPGRAPGGAARVPARMPVALHERGVRRNAGTQPDRRGRRAQLPRRAGGRGRRRQRHCRGSGRRGWRDVPGPRAPLSHGRGPPASAACRAGVRRRHPRSAGGSRLLGGGDRSPAAKQGGCMSATTSSVVSSGGVGEDAAVRDAIVQTVPLYEMMRMRAATTARRHPSLGFAAEDRESRMRWVNQFTHTHRRLGPNDREVVSPNNDTVYSNAWLDLSHGPVLIDTPDMGDRYWTLGLLDAWTNPFAYVGRRTTGNRRQRTLVHGPGWRGEPPAGVDTVIAAPGDDVWIIGRILVADTP